MSLLWLEHVSDSFQPDVRRLAGISPLFVSVMRAVDAEACQALFKPLAEARLPDAGEAWVPPCDSDDVATCMQHLRQCKQHGMRHIIWWELGVHGDIEASCRAIADFASGLLALALSMAVRLTMPRYGRLESGSFCVIALGKLGGRELNLGSDVDLLFIWQGEGTTSGGRKQISAIEYYGHISRMLIRLMSERTGDGIVWPVDMRLRPGGDAAAIALNLDASLGFYESYGQTWERAMLIKARPVAGDLALGDAFVQGIAAFIYRRYLDYTTVAALAEMKRRIDRQAGGDALAPGFDVKRGQGGIREIEFIIQSMQLLHGGSREDLRVTPSMIALKKLEELGIMSAVEADTLRHAYCFWRRVEHAIQARLGEQTQKLPDQFETYLGAALGDPDILTRMQDVCSTVQRAFARYVLPHEQVDMEGESWLLGEHADELAALDGESWRRIGSALEQIDAHLMRGILPERSRSSIETILSHAMPRWLDDANGVTAVEAFADLIRGIAGRATWIDLLATHKGALDWLIGVLSASRYLAGQIAQDPSWLEWPLMVERRDIDIQQVCSRLDTLELDDAEQALADIGHWVNRGRLLSALAVDAHTADVMTVAGWLADTADAATSAVLRFCLMDMQLPDDFPLVALAMGKHGSQEMGLVSDLDMVFVLVHDEPGAMLGRRSFGEHAQRLGRRMIQYLTGAPPFGAGFQFDARLRPSGSSGVLVTSLKGFHEYQLHEAQTWEHQALCRARTVAGPETACAAVSAVVCEILERPRDHQKLAEDVVCMRQKMLDHLSGKTADIINLKQDAGGLVDIEFLAQYARLAFGISARRTADIYAGIAGVAPDLWTQEADFLAQSYLDYRQMENALRVELWRSIGRLSGDPQANEWKTMHRHTAIHTPETLKQRMAEVHDIFCRLLNEQER